MKKTGSITTRIYETFLAILESRHNSCHGIEEEKREYRVRKIESATSRETRLILARVYLLTTSTFSCEFFTIKGARIGIKALRRPVSMQIHARNTECLLLAFRHLISRVNIPLVGPTKFTLLSISPSSCLSLHHRSTNVRTN